MENKNLPAKVAPASAPTILDIVNSPDFKKQVAAVLPKILKPERFLGVVINAMTKNPDLLKCTQASLIGSLLSLSQMGLEPDSRKAHLIPYFSNKLGVFICEPMVDYKGLVELMRRANTISDIHADVVYEGDFFEYEYGTNKHLTHKPDIKKIHPKEENPIAVYSFVKMKDGSDSFEVMSLDQINAVKARSKALKSGPWITDENEMRKKCVIRRHSKILPSSPEMQLALERDFDTPSDISPFPDEILAGKPLVNIPVERLSEPMAETPPIATEPARPKAEAPSTEPIPEKQPEAVKSDLKTSTPIPQDIEFNSVETAGLCSAGDQINIRGLLKGHRIFGPYQKKDGSGTFVKTSYLVYDDKTGKEIFVMRFGPLHEGLTNGAAVYCLGVKLDLYNDKITFNAAEVVGEVELNARQGQ